MNPARFEALQKAVSHISRLGDTRDRVKASMIEAQQMYHSMKAIGARSDKIEWTIRQQKLWTKAYWKAHNNYMNALKEGGQ